MNFLQNKTNLTVSKLLNSSVYTYIHSNIGYCIYAYTVCTDVLYIQLIICPFNPFKFCLAQIPPRSLKMSWKSFTEMVSSPSTTLNRYVMAGGALGLAWLNDLFRGSGASGCDLTEHQYNLTQGSSHYRKCLVIRSPKPSGQISPPIREGPRWHHKAHASRCRDNKASRQPHL